MHFNLLGETYPTTVNGPGNRYLIHLQGCGLGCKSCFNPESWSFKTKKIVSVEELADRILNLKPDGLSISGGEPFQQSAALLHFLKYIHKKNPQNCPFPKGVLVFSGFYENELHTIKEYEQILTYVDVIVSGRFLENERVYDSLLSSNNQKFIWGNRGLIIPQDVMKQDYEIIIEKDGLKLTGFPQNWDKQVVSELKSKGIKIG
jgi:anaerobic ribonucleoside-triphosphate reductase activating protein